MKTIQQCNIFYVIFIKPIFDRVPDRPRAAAVGAAFLAIGFFALLSLAYSKFIYGPALTRKAIIEELKKMDGVRIEKTIEEPVPEFGNPPPWMKY